MTHELTQKAMLARLSIQQWSARKLDRQATEKVKSDFNTSSDAGRYNKALIATNALKAVQQAASEARTYHYTNTLPWQDDGARILPATNFMQYSEGMRKLRANFDKAVAAFITEYPALVEDAKSRLQALFNAMDYPKDITAKYSFAVQIDPMPNGSDFRVELQAEELNAIRNDIERRTADATEAATRDLWDRLHSAVAAMVDRLSSPDAIFRDSLVENVVELVDLLPRLNLTGDPDLEAMRQEVTAKLTAHEPETLRRDKNARAAVAQDAAAIMSAMQGYMSPL